MASRRKLRKGDILRRTGRFIDVIPERSEPLSALPSEEDPARGHSHSPGAERSDAPGGMRVGIPTPEGSQHSADESV